MVRSFWKTDGLMREFCARTLQEKKEALVGSRSVIPRDLCVVLGFPGGSDSKESACRVGGLGLIPGLERSPGEGNDYSLQYPARHLLPWNSPGQNTGVSSRSLLQGIFPTQE